MSRIIILRTCIVPDIVKGCFCHANELVLEVACVRGAWYTFLSFGVRTREQYRVLRKEVSKQELCPIYISWCGLVNLNGAFLVIEVAFLDKDNRMILCVIQRNPSEPL